ncbi:hypothetical protein ACWKW1_11490 [Brevibacillus parabrevis]
MGRSFANLHIKSGNFEKAVEALKKLSEVRAEVLGYSSTQDEYGLKEERFHDDYMREALGIRVEDFDSFIRLTSPEQAADKLSQLAGIPIWSDSEWLPYEEKLRDQFGQYEFQIENA